MAVVELHGVRIAYETVGDGLPLLLLPGPAGAWEPTLPLLGELCRAIAPGAPTPETPRAEAVILVEALAHTLGLERFYLASQEPSWGLALEYAVQHPTRLEGCVLLATAPLAADTCQRLTTLTPRLPAISAPTLLLMTAQVRATCPAVALLQTHLSRCTTQVVADAPAATDPSRFALQLGHAMMAFLVQCERRRHLVRGASFLL